MRTELQRSCQSSLSSLRAGLYLYTEEELISHYYPNLKAINSIKLEENILNKTEINNILNMKICDLYNEYLETIEFKEDIEEISKIEGEKYGIKYKNYAEAFLKD